MDWVVYSIGHLRSSSRSKVSISRFVPRRHRPRCPSGNRGTGLAALGKRGISSSIKAIVGIPQRLASPVSGAHQRTEASSASGSASREDGAPPPRSLDQPGGARARRDEADPAPLDGGAGPRHAGDRSPSRTLLRAPGGALAATPAGARSVAFAARAALAADAHSEPRLGLGYFALRAGPRRRFPPRFLVADFAGLACPEPAAFSYWPLPIRLTFFASSQRFSAG